MDHHRLQTLIRSVRALALGLAMATFAAGCVESEQFTQRSFEQVGRELPISSVAHEAQLSDRTVHLEVQLWLDRMPMAPPTPRGLGVFVQIVDERGEWLTPTAVVASRVMLVRGAEVWESTLVSRGRPDWAWTPAAGGPLWEPGARVDIIVEIIERGGGEPVLLARLAAPVGVTY
jgi:hypothetical protein